MTSDLWLIKNELTALPTIFFIKVGLKAAAGETDAAFSKENFWARYNSVNNFKWKKMYDIMKIFKSLEKSGLLIKLICKTIKCKGKEEKGEFLGMLFGILVASLLGSAITGREVTRRGEETIRAAQIF